MSVTEELSPLDTSLRYIGDSSVTTSTGIDPTKLMGLTSTEVSHLINYISTISDVTRWVLADLLVWGEEQAALIVGYRTGARFWSEREALWTGMVSQYKGELALHTLYNMVGTAKAFPHHRRRHTQTLSFEHHRLLVARSEEEQEGWLDQADSGEWSAAKLRAELFAPKDNPHVDMTPKAVWTHETVWREMERQATEGLLTVADATATTLQILAMHQH